MRTVQPAIVIGNYGWDEDRLPRDEFDLRRAELERLMDAQGWSAILIHGDADEHGPLAHYTNFVPRLRWAMALLPRRGEPRLLVSMSSRDMPAMKLMTWIADVRSGWDWTHFDTWLAGAASGGATLGTLGFDRITGNLYRAVEKSLGNRVRLAAAEPFLPHERPLRPREMTLARDATSLLHRAAAAIELAWRQGAGNEAAVLAGERLARSQGAHDVRALASLDGGVTLVPFSGRLDARREPLVAHVAVKAAGLWAERFLTVGEAPLRAPARAALAAALAALQPRANADAVAAAAFAALRPHALHPVLGGRLGRRIGFSLDEGGALVPGANFPIAPGSLYALHTGATDAFGGAILSAMVAVTERGAEPL